MYSIASKLILLSSSAGNEKNDYAGGGDILKYIGNSESKAALDEMDVNEILKLAAIPLIKYIIVALLIVIAALLIMRMMKFTVVKRGKGAEKQLKNIEKIRKKEKQIISINTAVNKWTDYVEHSPFRLSYAEEKELQYKIHRADIKSIDSRSLMSAQIYNALKLLAKLVLIFVGLILILTVNITFGTILVIMAITITNAVADIYIKSRVDAKDMEIKMNFTGFYLMIHYVLMRNPNAPLLNIIQSYDKTTDSNEMHKLVDICTHNFNTYGEYTGSTYVADEYKGVNEVVKLMRLVRQAGSGGDIRSELEGFKRELINEEGYRADIKKNKALALADRAKLIIMILLAQGVISAVTIYLQDIGGSLANF